VEKTCSVISVLNITVQLNI